MRLLKIRLFLLIILIMTLVIPLYTEGGSGDGSTSTSNSGSDQKDCAGRDSNDGNYGNCGGGPTAEQIEKLKKLEEAKATRDDIEKERQLMIERGNHDLAYEMGFRVEEANREVERRQAAYDATLTGDPVLITTGRFLLEETDVQIPGSVFDITRVYVSENLTTGSFAQGWYSSLDSRIIRGVSKIDENALADLQNFVNFTLEGYNKINKNYTETAEIAQEIYDEYYLPALSQLEEILEIKKRSDELSVLNRYALFAGTPEYYEGVGNERLTLVDESGSPRVFEPAGDGVWVPVNNPERMYEKIVTKDGKGADSLSGFVYYTRGGVKKEYCGNGLLVKVEELNGRVVEIERDSEGKITKIKGPHGNEWEVTYSGNYISRIKGVEGEEVIFGYNGNALVSVKDTYGDTIRYEYESGNRLNAIVKPDGSAIRLEYGLSGQDGTKLVTSTSHEEGAKERFEYFPSQRLTVYTNHSGVVTRYRYDENHRTVEEVHSDGTVKTFAYNGNGQLSLERINGFEIRYSYDSRGNITEKSYSDGRRETWQYNANDQVIRYTDRDNVLTEWIYDVRGNCTEVRRGGLTIFTGVYDDRNRLVSSREGERAEVRYEYDGRDYPVRRTVNVNGNTITQSWLYDNLGRVLRYTDELGRVWEYEHGQKETTEKTPAGLVRRYVYNNRKQLVSVEETDVRTGEVRETKVDYDRRHLPLSVTDGEGNVTRYEYREDGNLILQRSGHWYVRYEYEAGGRISEIIRSKEGSEQTYKEMYDYQRHGFNQQLSVNTGSGTSLYNMDIFGNVTTVTNALGESSTRTLNGSGNVTREQGASGGYYEYRYDASGRVVQAGRENEASVRVTYNRDGSISQKTDRLGNVTRYIYDGRGLLTTEITSLGEIRYRYDEGGRLVRQEVLTRNSSGVYYTDWVYNDGQRTVTITSGGVYSVTLHLNAWGEVVRRVDGEGNEQRYEYDRSGKLVTFTDGYGRSERYGWNAIGKIETVTFTDGKAEKYEYDHIGNVIRVEDELGVSWRGEYDNSGRLIKESGRPGINREYVYDALGRIVEVRNGGEVVERYRYTERGRQIIFTDGSGADYVQRKNVYGELTDELNRMTDSQRYVYDAEGRVTSVISYSGKQTRVEYRDAEGIVVTTYSDGTQSLIQRDMAGNVIRASNEVGVIRYRYDAGGRLIEQTDEGASEVTRYAYDRAARRVRMQSSNRDVHYSYGRNNELLRVIDNTQRLEVRYEYDVRGRETRRVYGNGIRQETVYDAIGRVIVIRESDSRNQLFRAEGYLYDHVGRRSHSVDERGNVTRYEYDNQSRLAAVFYPWTREKMEADRKEAEEAGLYFTIDRGIGERITFSAVEFTALRDILNRVSPALGNAVQSGQLMWRESYIYDRNGNRASKTNAWGVIRYEYDSENRLVKKGDIVYVNDKDGNTLSERGLRYEAVYEYNAQNRMVYSEVTSHVEKTHTVTTYAYDAFGRRTLTGSVTGQVLRTVYDGRSFEVIREGETFRDGTLTTQFTNNSNTRSTLQNNEATGERYRWIGEDGNARSVTEDGYTVQSGRFGTRGVTLYANGEAVAVSTSTRTSYLGKDIMGSVRSSTSDNGVLEDRYEYDVFGTPYSGDLSGSMNLGYMTKPYDVSTGLYNYGFRDYKPTAARFTTVDPIRDGNNWFLYVNNDPVNYIDLWGLCKGDVRKTVYNDFYIETMINLIANNPEMQSNVSININRSIYDTSALSNNKNSENHFLSTISIQFDNINFGSFPVQSSADHPRLNEEGYIGHTLSAGDYKGTIVDTGRAYNWQIHLVGGNGSAPANWAFSIHPDKYTGILEGGPWNQPHSLGCQIMRHADFEIFKNKLEQFGFSVGNSLKVKINAPVLN